jgi:hypothetical protein
MSTNIVLTDSDTQGGGTRYFAQHIFGTRSMYATEIELGHTYICSSLSFLLYPEPFVLDFLPFPPLSYPS